MLATTLRRPRALVPALLLAAGAALPASAALAAPAVTAADLTGSCTDETGVTVVVDATELEGDLAVGCATDAATGTEALAQAGFTEGRDPSGYICAVNGLPDPCPTEFTGSYWSYWTASPGGEWTAYAEGSDTAVPASGSVEGWRYGDGTQPPGVTPAEVTPGATPGAPPAEDADGADDPTAEDAGSEDAEGGDDRAVVVDAEGGDGMPLAVGAAVGIAIIGGLVALIVRLRRQAQNPPQD